MSETQAPDDALFAAYYPEPWEADLEQVKYSDLHLRAQNGSLVGEVANVDTFPCFDGDPDEFDRACRVGARRIAAAMNACQGIPLADLEQMPTGRLSEAFAEARILAGAVQRAGASRWGRDRIVLRDALREVAELLDGEYRSAENPNAVVSRARLLISSALAQVEEPFDDAA